MHWIAPSENDIDAATLEERLNEEARTGFIMVNGATNRYSCSMKITEGVCKRRRCSRRARELNLMDAGAGGGAGSEFTTGG